jgi:hypothetical protein
MLGKRETVRVVRGPDSNDEADRKFLLRKAKDWTKLAITKEPEIRAAAKTAA